MFTLCSVPAQFGISCLLQCMLVLPLQLNHCLKLAVHLSGTKTFSAKLFLTGYIILKKSPPHKKLCCLSHLIKHCADEEPRVPTQVGKAGVFAETTIVRVCGVNAKTKSRWQSMGEEAELLYGFKRATTLLTIMIRAESVRGANKVQVTVPCLRLVQLMHRSVSNDQGRK